MKTFLFPEWNNLSEDQRRVIKELLKSNIKLEKIVKGIVGILPQENDEELDVHALDALEIEILNLENFDATPLNQVYEVENYAKVVPESVCSVICATQGEDSNACKECKGLISNSNVT